MEKNISSQKSRETAFREKAANYVVCYSTDCQLRDHCLRSILSRYVPDGQRLVTSINLTNQRVQTGDCPEYRDDQPVRMPFGLFSLYNGMPGQMERAIKQRLISVYTRKRYYEYRKGTRPITPDVEAYIRQTLKEFGWEEEPRFTGYVEDYLW